MKTLEPVLIDTSLRFGQMDIMQWFPETTEDDAQSALVAAQEAADAFFSDHWEDYAWMVDFDVAAVKLAPPDYRWQVVPIGARVRSDADFYRWRCLRSSLLLMSYVLVDADYQRPLVDEILREIEETRTREAVEAGRW